MSAVLYITFLIMYLSKVARVVCKESCRVASPQQPRRTDDSGRIEKRDTVQSAGARKRQLDPKILGIYEQGREDRGRVEFSGEYIVLDRGD